MRAVLDPNVVISAILSSAGPPARCLEAWTRGEFEIVVSPKLLRELEGALAYPKLRKRIPEADAQRVVEWLRRLATMRSDPDESPSRSADPGDDYLVALAARERALLVSGDKHLLALAEELPVYSPASFLELLAG